MPPRTPLRLPVTTLSSSVLRPSIQPTRLYATASAVSIANPDTSRYALTQPPSHRAATSRKTLLQRTYLSLLRSTPLMIFFQHNNLRAVEWMAIRRELVMALEKVDEANPELSLAGTTKITLVQSGVFASAMRVAEFYDATEGSAHGTSREAYEATIDKKKTHQLSAIITGPVGVLTFPTVSPPHLKVALGILFPEKGPKRGLDPLATTGLQKLMLLAARVDGNVSGGQIGNARVLDGANVKWISTLPGVQDLRGQLIAVLRSVGGADLVRNLESVGLGLARTVEARRKMLDEEANPGEKKEE
ncbi:hypothetical protein RUND412_002780 [Rhizina undulata]